MVDRMIRPRLAASQRSVLILGPRQTGKSTLCKSLRPDLALDLSDEEAYLRHAKDPGLFKRILAAASRARVILIDEIQRLPALLNTIQSILDRPNAPRFLLTGSSARKLRREGANLLPGRIVVEHLDALSALEIGPRFDLSRALQVGTLPGIYLDPRGGRDELSTYSETYLREEIRAEAHTRNLGGFARFLDAAAATSGQWVNYSKMASDAEIPKETVRRFYDLLEDTLIAFRLPAFRPRLRVTRRLSQRDRFVFFDVGVRNALLGLHRHPATADRIGDAFEQWLIAQIAGINHALRKDWALSAYRTEDGAEVDLVVETDRAVLGIEIKAGRNVRPAELGGLRSLGEVIGRYKPFERIVATTGAERQRIDPHVLVLPYLDLLGDLARRR